ncbi:uncharacterized protein [Henckelia pumila]|uniref:uncharacterized protein n=1 Tax=Henckelia pumila TaxID=405737 RepID=UPI003C6E2442
MLGLSNNNIVISWLLNSVSKDISTSILFAESAADIWIDLQDRFQQSNGPRIFQLRRDLVSLRQGQDPVSVYFTKLKTFWDELNHFRPMCNCGKCVCYGVKNIDAYFQMDYTMTFLMGLNDSFAHVRSQILLTDPLPSITRVFALIVQEERQRVIGSSIPDIYGNGMAFAIKGENSQKYTTSRVLFKPQRGRPYCTSCKAPGHTIETCYKIHGYPPGYKHRTSHISKDSSNGVNQVSVSQSPSHETSTSNVFQGLDKSQMDQLVSSFMQHLTTLDNKNVHHEVNNVSSPSGLANQEDDWQG